MYMCICMCVYMRVCRGRVVKVNKVVLMCVCMCTCV